MIQACLRVFAVLFGRLVFVESIRMNVTAQETMPDLSGLAMLNLQGGLAGLGRLGSGGGRSRTDRGCMDSPVKAAGKAISPTDKKRLIAIGKLQRDYLCAGLSKHGWECRFSSIYDNGQKAGYSSSTCPEMIDFPCSCSQPGFDGTYDLFKCNEANNRIGLDVDHTVFLQFFKENTCPMYVEACTDKANADDECSETECLNYYPRYKGAAEAVESLRKMRGNPVRPFRNVVDQNQGCYIGLTVDFKHRQGLGDDGMGIKVRDTIASYLSLSKCCYREDENGRIYTWLHGSELTAEGISRSSLKWWRGTRACKDPWKSAVSSGGHWKHDVDTEDKCLALNR